jgi:small conductance mechanosensitive channel
MEFISELVQGSKLVQTILVIGGLVLLMYVANRRLAAYFESLSVERQRHLRYRRQLLQMAGVLLAILLLILWLPLPEGDLRTNLLYIFGGVISAAIALSSTTLVGNVMAGAMLRIVNNLKPGDYITVGDHFGRITEMDMLHTELQTERRDLTTLPNLYMVTNPVRVMQSSGTVLSVDVSLGYGVPRPEIEQALVAAAQATGLEKPYVQIRALGDFSVTYSISGLLSEVKHLLAKRRELRARTMDELHRAGIEIVSPTFMNTRAYAPGDTFIPEVIEDDAEVVEQAAPDELVFDKAMKAESISNLRQQLEEWEGALKELDTAAAGDESTQARAGAGQEREALQQKIERLKAIIPLISLNALLKGDSER